MKFLNLEINQKNYIRILCLCVFLIILIVIINYLDLMLPKKITLDESTKVCSFEEEPLLVVHIDLLSPLELMPGDNKIEIAGYAYLTDDEVFTVDCNYALKNKGNGKIYLLKTWHEKNVNVPSAYPYAGIHTRFMTFGIEKGEYEICVLYRNNENDFFKSTGIEIKI